MARSPTLRPRNTAPTAGENLLEAKATCQALVRIVESIHATTTVAEAAQGPAHVAAELQRLLEQFGNSDDTSPAPPRPASEVVPWDRRFRENGTAHARMKGELR